MKLNLKYYFIILIAFILMLFIINIVSNNNKIIKTIEKIPKNLLKKTLGIKIEKQNFKGETFVIKADELEEDKIKKRIHFKNSVTILKNDNTTTKIFSGFAVVNNNYQDFNLSNEVKIINNKKNLVLKTENLNGHFKNGSMFTEKKVNLKIRNIYIYGQGLKFLNHGEYIKVFGKAKLITKQND